MIELRADGLGKRFGARIVFRDLTLRAVGGSTVAVTGPNGSGKSTLVRILAGVLRPTRGTVALTVDGTEVAPRDRPFRTGLVAPYLNLYDRFSPRENLSFIARARRLPGADRAVESALDQVGLAARMDDLVATFSSGMKQRVRLAAAVLCGPDVLLLDEPGSNLDDAGRAVVDRIVASSVEAGRVVIVATNDAAEAARCREQVSVA